MRGYKNNIHGFLSHLHCNNLPVDWNVVLVAVDWMAGGKCGSADSEAVSEAKVGVYWGVESAGFDWPTAPK